MRCQNTRSQSNSTPSTRAEEQLDIAAHQSILLLLADARSRRAKVPGHRLPQCRRLLKRVPFQIHSAGNLCRAHASMESKYGALANVNGISTDSVDDLFEALEIRWASKQNRGELAVQRA